MNFFKRFFDFILFSNIYVALGAVCLVAGSSIQLKQSHLPLNYLLLIFFATLFVYNFQRIFYKRPENIEHPSVRRIWIAKNIVILKILAGIGLGGSILLFFFNDFHVIYFLLPLLLLALFYFMPTIKFRKNPVLKLATLVTVWTIATSLTPAILQGYPTKIAIFIHTAARFWFMMAICIPFDIRDMEQDKKENVVTIALILGENKSRWLALFCMLIYSIFIIIEFISGVINLKLLNALILATIINSILILMSSTKRNEYFYVAGLDGTMILQGVVAAITTLLL